MDPAVRVRMAAWCLSRVRWLCWSWVAWLPFGEGIAKAGQASQNKENCSRPPDPGRLFLLWQTPSETASVREQVFRGWGLFRCHISGSGGFPHTRFARFVSLLNEPSVHHQSIMTRPSASLDIFRALYTFEPRPFLKSLHFCTRVNSIGYAASKLWVISLHFCRRVTGITQSILMFFRSNRGCETRGLQPSTIQSSQLTGSHFGYKEERICLAE